MSFKLSLSHISSPSHVESLEYDSVKKMTLFCIALLGTILEYFEYAIYGFLAPTLALHFFPSDDPTVSLIKTFGIFAVGSLSKPIGALIFGYLGDTKGRSLTLRYTMIGIAIPTFLVGLLPSYQSWGMISIIILIFFRMLQGIFMAGESDGVRIYIFEHFGHKRPCLTSSCISFSAYTGIGLAAFVASQIPLTGEAWRWAFLGSGMGGLLIYTLRHHLLETPPFLRSYQQKHHRISLKNIFQTHWPSLVKTMMICGSVGGIYHFYFVFQSTYLSKVLNFTTAETTTQLGLSFITLYILSLPLAGWAADRWGYTTVGKIGGISTCMFAIINITMIMDGIIFPFLMALTTFSTAFFVVPCYLFVTQQYDVHIRFRCLSIGHALGSTLFSGTNPVICLFLWQTTQLPYAPYLYFLFLVIMGLCAFTWKAKENAYNAWFL